MRFALVSVLAAGCYAPKVTAGAPCDPDVGNCPRPLMCVPGPSGFTCETSGGATADDAAVDVAADAEIDARADAAIDAGIDASPVMHLEYPSVVAECVNPAAPDPTACFNVNNGLAIDANDTATGNPWHGFVRFDLDNMLAGRVVTSVKLRMSTTADPKADSANSGTVGQVSSFTRMSLFTAEPTPMAVLAGSQGAVMHDQDVFWPLPTTIVSANGSVFLGLVTPTSDGTVFYNQAGLRPPRLIIDLQ